MSIEMSKLDKKYEQNSCCQGWFWEASAVQRKPIPERRATYREGLFCLVSVRTKLDDEHAPFSRKETAATLCIQGSAAEVTKIGLARPSKYRQNKAMIR